MANNDVHVTMTAASGQAQQAWLSIIGTLEQMEARLRSMGNTGVSSGRRTAQEMGGIATAAERIGNTLATLVGVGSPLAAMLTTAQLIRGELEKTAALRDDAKDSLLRRSQAIAELTSNIGLGKTDSSGKPFGPTEMERLISREAAKARIPQTAYVEAMPALVSSTAGILPPDVIASIPGAVARAYPHLGLRPEELGKTARSVGELMKSQQMRGSPITPEQAMSAFASTFELAAAGSTDELEPLLGFMAERAMTNKKNQLHESLAQVTAIQQAMVDPSGRRTATNVSLGIGSAFDLVFKYAPELRNESDETIRTRIRDATEATDPRMLRLRKELLGSRAPGVTDDEIKKLGFQAGTMKGEQRAEAAVQAMFVKGSWVDQQIEAAKQSEAKVLDPATVQKKFDMWSANALSARNLPIRQELSRQASREMGAVSMTDAATSDQILDLTARSLRVNEVGLAIDRWFRDWDVSIAKSFGSGSPLGTAKRAVRQFDFAIKQKRSDLQAAKTPAERSTLEAQISALEQDRESVLETQRVIEARDSQDKAAAAANQQQQAQPLTKQRAQELAGWYRSLLGSEGVSDEYASRAMKGEVLTPESLPGFVASRRGALSLNEQYSPEQLRQMTPEQRARAAAEIAGEGRAIDRALPVLRDSNSGLSLEQKLDRLSAVVEELTKTMAKAPQAIGEAVSKTGQLVPPMNPVAPGAAALSGQRGRLGEVALY
ncbi:MAG: hypothetical protein AB7F89_16060 [Pirellulaceae bacterium]